MTKDIRALELYQLTQSVVDAKGHFVSVGLIAYKEYGQEELSIRCWPSTGHLELMRRGKTLLPMMLPWLPRLPKLYGHGQISPHLSTDRTGQDMERQRAAR
jgi:hypothetical protein